MFYNNVINRWQPFHSRAYVPVNLAFAAVVTLAATQVLDVTGDELGFHGDLVDLAVPVAIVAVVGAVMFGLAMSRHAHRIADGRVQGMRGGSLAFYTLARIPVGTAVVEEMLFWGVLVAVWLEAGASEVGAAVGASIAFGLWHISPTIIGVRMNDPAASSRKVGMAVAGAVVATTVSGQAGLVQVGRDVGGRPRPDRNSGRLGDIADRIQDVRTSGPYGGRDLGLVDERPGRVSHGAQVSRSAR